MGTGTIIIVVILVVILRYVIGPAIGLGDGSQSDYQPYDRDTFDNNRQPENHHHGSTHHSSFNNDTSQSDQSDNRGQLGSDHESRD